MQTLQQFCFLRKSSLLRKYKIFIYVIDIIHHALFNINVM